MAYIHAFGSLLPTKVVAVRRSPAAPGCPWRSAGTPHARASASGWQKLSRADGITAQPRAADRRRNRGRRQRRAIVISPRTPISAAIETTEVCVHGCGQAPPISRSGGRRGRQLGPRAEEQRMTLLRRRSRPRRARRSRLRPTGGKGRDRLPWGTTRPADSSRRPAMSLARHQHEVRAPTVAGCAARRTWLATPARSRRSRRSNGRGNEAAARGRREHSRQRHHGVNSERRPSINGVAGSASQTTRPAVAERPALTTMQLNGWSSLGSRRHEAVTLRHYHDPAHVAPARREPARGGRR